MPQIWAVIILVMAAALLLHALGYPVLQARRSEKLVVGIYHPRVAEIDLDGITEMTLLNATSQDRVVVRWIGESAGISGTIHAPTGAVVGEIDAVAENGIAEIVLPVSGIARIRVGARAR